MMKFGLAMSVTDETIDPVDLGRAAEEAGFESLFLPEHTHIPVSRETPGSGGRSLAREFPRTYDPFVALTAIAATTERLRIGTGVCLVVQHDPIVLAKQVASLDRICGGRFLFGVGAGWNHEEMRNHGTDPATRFALLRERILAMKAIWTEDEAAFHGEFVDFDPLWSWPRPVQRPHPPILVGGAGPSALDRVLDYGDAWFPIGRDPGELPERIRELRRRAEAHGRGTIPVTVFGVQPDDATVEAFATAGAERVLFSLPSAPAPETMARIDDYAKVARRQGTR